MPTPENLRVYEAMFLVDTGDAAAWSDLEQHLETLLTRGGGEIIGITRWDERKLAYPIGKHKRGTYVLAFFAMGEGGGDDGVRTIEHECRLSEKVIRLLVLRADQFKVRDMRAQLGEDVREDMAVRVKDARGEVDEPEPVAEPVAEPAAEPATAEPAAAPVEPPAPADTPAPPPPAAPAQ